MKKIKDPYPITDVYHIANTLVDGATVTVTDLCENLSNSFHTDSYDIENEIKKIDTKKFNSISVSNGADGVYPVWAGVDKNNKVRKIFVETNAGSFFDTETRALVSWHWDKSDMNDQFFSKFNHKSSIKRSKLFDMKINSGAIAMTDHGGHFNFEHDDFVKRSLNEKYFKKGEIFQNNYPIGLYIFEYGNKATPKQSSFASSEIHNKNVLNLEDYKKNIYIEFLSNLLDESCYPTKYIFEEYLKIEKNYRDVSELKIIDKKISAESLYKKLPHALKILNKQTRILFKDNFSEVFAIRKRQFEDFIFSIIKDIEPQELDLPTFGKKKKEKKKVISKLELKTAGLAEVQEMLYEGYKLKSDPVIKNTPIFPVKNGSYPCYLHIYPDKSETDDDYKFNYVKIVVEGIEGCYLNKNIKNNLVLRRKIEKNPVIENYKKNKSYTVKLDQVDLGNSENLEILKELTFVKELELHGLKKIKDWNNLSKLKNLRTLKLVSCDVSFDQSINFFTNLYSLRNLEKFTIDDSCSINLPLKSFPKNLYFKNLKRYEIQFRKEWQKNTSEEFKDHQGYGNENLYFLNFHVPQIHRFPNFEKFNSLEVFNIYNIFDEENSYGSYFNYSETHYENIKKVIKKSKKLKDIWLHGFDYLGSISHYPKSTKQALEVLLDDKKIRLNGKKYKNESYKIKNLKTLILDNKIEKIFKQKINSISNDEVNLNYFAIIDDKDDLNFLKNYLDQKPEEIIIENTYQFLRSEIIYCDTLEPLKKHVKQDKKLKKIKFKLNNEIVDENYGDMSGSFSGEECKRLIGILIDLIKLNKNLKIEIEIIDLSSQLKDLENLNKYIWLFELQKLYEENKSTKDKINIKSFGVIKKDIYQAIERYYLEVADTIVVIEDNVGWNDSKLIKNIEINEKFDFEEPNPFLLGLGTEEIKLDYGGVEPHKKESNFLNRMFENEVFWNYSEENLNHFLNSSYEYDKPILIVKQKFLNQSNKTIFKNIKHFYYYAQEDYSFDEYDQIHYKKFWKENEKFRFPKSVKFNSLETLNIYGGRDIELSKLSSQIDCTNLKQLILHECVGNDRSFPHLPNLKTLIIHDKYQAKAKDYNKFSNIKNVEHLEFKNLYNSHHITGRWQTTEFDFTEIFKLSKLKTLKLNEINPEYLPPIKTLKSLEELELSFKLITGDMYSDDGIINESLIDKDFEFLKNLTTLKKLKIEFPLDEKKIKGSELCSYINPGLEELNLELHYEDSDISYGNEFLNKISKLKNLKKLILRLGRTDKIEFSEKNKYYYFRKTGEKWNDGELGPRPFVLDFNKIIRLKKLEQFAFGQSFRDDMGFKIINVKKITRLKKLKHLNIKPSRFKTEDLKYIKRITTDPRDEFLNKCKNKDKSIRSEYSLNEKDKKKYDKLDREIKIGEFGYYDRTWNNSRIASILEKRKKEKNETAN